MVSELMNMDWNVVAPVVVAVTGSQALTQLVQGFFNRKKTSADAAQLLVDKTLEWASKLAARVEMLEKEIQARDMVIAELRQGIAHLESCKLDK